MTSAARPLQRDGDHRGSIAPQSVPVESFIELRIRRYRTLIEAGIESDLAWEIAHSNALETLRAKSHDADDYENSTQVYGVTS